MNNPIENQKLVAKDVLDKLEIIDPHAILAGGAPRDWYFGNEARDLDFYFCSTATTTLATKRQLTRVFGDDVSLLMESDEDRCMDLYKTMEGLIRIWEITVEGVPVQLIQMLDSACRLRAVDQMDISICKVWWKGGDIERTKDFKLTEASGIMFLKDGHSWGSKHSIKMIEKFPNLIIGTRKQAESFLISRVLREV